MPEERDADGFPVWQRWCRFILSVCSYCLSEERV